MKKHIKVIGSIGYLGGVMSVPEPFAWSWSQMVEFNHSGLCGAEERIHYDRSRLGLHDYARNELCGRMLGDWIMMLDTDLQFEPDTAMRLVRSMLEYDLDVVTGLYVFKSPPHAPVLYHHNAEADRYETIGRWDRTQEVFGVDSAGGGLMVIRRRLLERIRDELKENPFNREGQYGEDHSFFRRVRKLGVQPYCAWKVQAGHLAYKPLGLADLVPGAQVIGEYPVKSFGPALAGAA